MNAATIRYLAEESDTIPAELPEHPTLARAITVGGRSARILLAEDDPEMRSMLASALRADGYEVTEAPSGAALLEEISMLLFQGQPVPADVIVSDERMPG